MSTMKLIALHLLDTQTSVSIFCTDKELYYFCAYSACANYLFLDRPHSGLMVLQGRCIVHYVEPFIPSGIASENLILKIAEIPPQRQQACHVKPSRTCHIRKNILHNGISLHTADFSC
eukprot:TRINITY_DN5946_c0_g1_i5.p1 TRINITY_DN5946_c0_g1~~TRINITY_DN5946_c0_g1_i5.p1  ORF type:complete len:118 (-),score=4.07 TRINITY_DN5946_c0_g1_i5:254-607(-)